MNTALKVTAIAALMAIAALWGSNPATWSLVFALIAAILIVLALCVYALKMIGGAILGAIMRGCALVVLVAVLLGCAGVSSMVIYNRVNSAIVDLRCNGNLTRTDNPNTYICTSQDGNMFIIH